MCFYFLGLPIFVNFRNAFHNPYIKPQCSDEVLNIVDASETTEYKHSGNNWLCFKKMCYTATRMKYATSGYVSNRCTIWQLI